MKKIGGVFFALLMLVSCSSGKLNKNQIVSESETVIIGKFTILNNGKEVTKNSRIYFDENSKGVLTYRLDETGIVIMKLPKGNHFLKLIYTPYGSSYLPDGYANISVPESGKAYYIGNIEIDGSGLLQKKFSGIIIDVQAKDLKEKKLPIRIIDKPDEVLEAYQNEFGREKTVSVKLLEISS